MREKLLSLQAAVEFVKSGSSLGLTSASVENAPMAFLRELVGEAQKI